MEVQESNLCLGFEDNPNIRFPKTLKANGITGSFSALAS
jgi:hypothetical protein